MFSTNYLLTDKPGPPTGPLRTMDVTKTTITLVWEPPEDNGGAPITCYQIELREANRTAWHKAGTSVENTYTVPGLVEGMSYVFRVSAENQYGIGDPLEGRESIMAKAPFGKYQYLS